MKVYIAGKITGDPDYRAKFKRAEDALREEGHTVINPAVLPAGLYPADYGRICFAMLDSADAVCFLPDFNQSQGASLEHEYSEYTGKKIMYIGDEYRAFEDQRIAPADALRGPTREQVDRVLGSMWEFDANNFEYNWRCVTCGTYTDIKTDFCPRCGRPMTDEAVEILLKRLEVLKDEID